MQPTKIKVYIVIFILAVIAILYFYDTQVQQVQAKCPDDYVTSEDQMTALNDWTNSFYDSHPGSTLSDWSTARLQYWIDNKCTKAIERYNEAKSGNADSGTMKLINDTVQETVNEYR